MASISHWGMFPLDRFPPEWQVRWSQERNGWLTQWSDWRIEHAPPSGELYPVRTPSICEGRPL